MGMVWARTNVRIIRRKGEHEKGFGGKAAKAGINKQG